MLPLYAAIEQKQARRRKVVPLAGTVELYEKPSCPTEPMTKARLSPFLNKPTHSTPSPDHYSVVLFSRLRIRTWRIAILPMSIFPALGKVR